MELSGLERWQPLLGAEMEKPYFAELCRRVDAARAAGPVYPPEEDVFAAFRATPPEQVRVVILGQDPYHGFGQAHGLAFSVRSGVKLPPSLVNIYKELESDLGIAPTLDGCLSGWAQQGVFLLNSVLTVDDSRPASHQGFGWETFTDAVVEALRTLPQPVAFLLWGNAAQKKAARAAESPYPRLVLCAPHPSPLGAWRGFFGSRPFSAVSRFLQENGEPPLDWSRRH